MREVSIGQYFRTIHDVNNGFGGRQDHAECIRYLVMTEILNLVDTPRSVQSAKSESHVVLINLELKFRYHPY